MTDLPLPRRNSVTGRRVRAPAVAGRFYSREPASLSNTVRALLDDVDVPESEPLARGYVVPHAGHRFSGPIAAQVYARLRRHADAIARVVLVGPSHFVPLTGSAVSTLDGWQTPLGEVMIDTVGCRSLIDSGHAVGDDAPHAPEHSLEVQLPFLQEALGTGFSLVPIAVGQSTTEETAATLNTACTSEEGSTVLLCSTDLSHHHDHPTAQRLDQRTAQAVLDLDPGRLQAQDACGIFALRATVEWAATGGRTPWLLDLRTSADTIGDPARVVGYSAFAFHAHTR